VSMARYSKYRNGSNNKVADAVLARLINSVKSNRDKLNNARSVYKAVGSRVGDWMNEVAPSRKSKGKLTAQKSDAQSVEAYDKQSSPDSKKYYKLLRRLYGVFDTVIRSPEFSTP